MATVWIVTTGNSDVRLDSNASKAFNTLKNDPKKPEKRKALGNCHTKFRPEDNVKKGEFSLEARVLGIVYGDAIDTHRSYFTFPLLDGFCEEIEKKNKPDRIIVLLTDQDAIFDTDKRSDPDCPYWKDTCTLKPIFEHYFQEKYDVKIEPFPLQPTKEQIGLDDWNATLGLVQDKFNDLDIAKNDDVIVSHQAGTPAISSAVQFASLSGFGDKVSFLTSNERTGVASLDQSSSYFESMQIEQAKKFLDNYDYVSVLSVLKGKLERLKEKNPDQADKILKLLEVAKLWNLSRFDEFESAMKTLPVEDLRNTATARFDDSWNWWIAYEEAYLGVIRREQGNIVEAFFHSFRAFEGIFAEWGNKIFKGNENIVKQKDIPCLKKDILQSDYKKYLAGSDLKPLREELSTEGILKLELMTLCKIFKKNRSDYKPAKCPDINIFWDNNEKEQRISVASRRNFIFHQVQGMEETQLMDFWRVDTLKKVEEQIEDWEQKLRCFLNFIADEKDFKTWGEASLMARVHKELEEEIGAIAQSLPSIELDIGKSR